jgi:hypothetical protein
LLHDATNDDSPLFNLPVCKKVRKKTLETFLERQAITKFTKYLCHACVEEAEINSSSYFLADKAVIERSDQEKSPICPGEDVLQENLIEESSTQSSLTSCIEIGTMLDNLITRMTYLIYTMRKISVQLTSFGLIILKNS